MTLRRASVCACVIVQLTAVVVRLIVIHSIYLRSWYEGEFGNRARKRKQSENLQKIGSDFPDTLKCRWKTKEAYRRKS